MFTLMKKTKTIMMAAGLIGLGCTSANAQYLSLSDSAFNAGAPMTGHIWGYVFGDYYYKAHSDELKRGEGNQFTGFNNGANAFDIRRAYLGYDFRFNKNFSSEFLLTSENWETSSKIAPTLKYANVQWNNIFKGSTLVIGMSGTPAFGPSSEQVWGYRSIEKTIADMHKTQSYDLGVALKGRFDNKGNFGYHIMVGNGSSASADKNNFRKFYGSVYGLFLDKKIMVNLYGDYERFDWQSGFHHAQNMEKIVLSYSGKVLTVGAEAFLRHGQSDVIKTSASGVADTTNGNSTGLSLFVRGNIIKEKLGFFARTDFFNAYSNFDNVYSYEGLSAQFDPNNKENFITAGLDFTPIKNVHIMPNVWYMGYHGQNSNLKNNAKSDNDLAFRMTFYYVFGK